MARSASMGRESLVARSVKGVSSADMKESSLPVKSVKVARSASMGRENPTVKSVKGVSSADMRESSLPAKTVEAAISANMEGKNLSAENAILSDIWQVLLKVGFIML